MVNQLEHATEALRKALVQVERLKNQNRVLLERVYRPYVQTLQAWSARVPSDGPATALARPVMKMRIPRFVKACRVRFGQAWLPSAPIAQ